MIEALSRFVEALRAEGLQVSPAEVVDAARAVDAVGPERRGPFRAALRATLVKRTEGLTVFDRVFERFFAPPARGSGRGERAAKGGVETGGQRTTRSQEEPAPLRRWPAEPVRPRPALRREAERARPRGPSPETLRERLRRLQLSGERLVGRVRRVVARREVVPERHAGEPPDLLRRQLKVPATTEEERRLAELVPRIVEELRLRRGRRLRRSRRGRLWARQLFRESAGREGVSFTLPFRRPRLRKTRVVLLVDVSWSTARAAGYFLWIATELLELGRRHRVVLFVDRPVDATETLARWGRRALAAATPSAPPRGRPRPGEGIARRGDSFASLLGSLRDLNLEAPSDYGRAFHALLRSPLRPRGRDTVLVVLGDARTNRFDPLPWALEEISRQCRGVLWLVPEPRDRWGEGDSALETYLPYVDTVVEATDLEGLARGVGKLLGRL